MLKQFLFPSSYCPFVRENTCAFRFVPHECWPFLTGLMPTSCVKTRAQRVPLQNPYVKIRIERAWVRFFPQKMHTNASSALPILPSRPLPSSLPNLPKLEKFAASNLSTLPKLETYAVSTVLKPADARQVAFTCPTSKATIYRKFAYKTQMCNKNASMFSSLAFAHLSFFYVKSRMKCRSLLEMLRRLEKSDRETIRENTCQALAYSESVRLNTYRTRVGSCFYRENIAKCCFCIPQSSQLAAPCAPGVLQTSGQGHDVRQGCAKSAAKGLMCDRGAPNQRPRA